MVGNEGKGGRKVARGQEICGLIGLDKNSRIYSNGVFLTRTSLHFKESHWLEGGLNGNGLSDLREC